MTSHQIDLQAAGNLGQTPEAQTDKLILQVGWEPNGQEEKTIMEKKGPQD